MSTRMHSMPSLRQVQPAVLAGVIARPSDSLQRPVAQVDATIRSRPHDPGAQDPDEQMRFRLYLQFAQAHGHREAGMTTLISGAGMYMRCSCYRSRSGAPVAREDPSGRILP